MSNQREGGGAFTLSVQGFRRLLHYALRHLSQQGAFCRPNRPSFILLLLLFWFLPWFCMLRQLLLLLLESHPAPQVCQRVNIQQFGQGAQRSSAQTLALCIGYAGCQHRRRAPLDPLQSGRGRASVSKMQLARW